MELTRRAFGITSLTALTGLALAATSFGPALASGNRGGVLRYGTVSEITNLDPHVYNGSAWKVLIGVIYSTLVAFNSKGEIVAGVAERWEQPDATTIVFHLRRDVTFQGGQTLTAADVVYSMERIQSESVGATLRSYLVEATVQAVDDFTVEIKKPAPDAALLSVLGLPEAAIVSKEWMESGVNFKANSNGTGPFALDAYEAGVSAKLKRNEGYFVKDEPLLDGVDFRMIKSDDARVSALRGGTLDMIDFVPWKDIDVLARMPNFKVDSASGAFMNIWFNATRAPWDNPQLRKAVAYAIDREAISRAAFFGHGAPIFGAPTPEDSPYHNTDLKGMTALDLEKARALMAESGYADGLTLEMVVFQGLGVYTTTAQVIQANLKQIGIDVQIKLVEWSDVVSRKNSGEYESMIYGVSMKLNDPDAYNYYFGSQSTYWAKPIGYQDDVLESLLAQGRAEVDVEKRKSIYRDVEERLLETSPWVFINYREQAQAYVRKVKGYVHIGGALNESCTAITLPTMSVG